MTTKANTFPVDSVTVVLGYQTKKGTEEVVHTIDGQQVQIVSCHHQIEKKVKAMKNEDGTLLGYEPTGEETLTLKVKYIKE